MAKKFGLEQARVLASEPNAHLPTVKATLKVLGVKNVVGQQVAQLVAGAKAVVAQTNQAIANLRTRDAEDERDTVQQIGDLRSGRDNRAKANYIVVASYDKTIGDHQQVIADLQELAKKFA